MFDLHLTHAIFNGIQYFKNNQSAFNGIFKQTNTTMKTKYYNRLVELADKIQIDVAFSRKIEKFPLISVVLAESTLEGTSFLGNAGHGGNLAQLTNQECRINIYAKDMTDIRILHQVIIASLLLFKQSFFDIHYLDIRYIQSRDLEPIDMLTNDNAIVYNRELIFMSTYQFEIAPVQDTNAFNLPWELNPSVEDF